MRALMFLLVASTASADERFAIAVNNPLGWRIENAAVSGYIGIDEHVAFRLNVASTRITRFEDFMADDCTHDGRTLDLGAGVEYFFRRRLDGPYVELGGLRRSENPTLDCSEERDPSRVVRYAGYATAGWSWALSHRVFIALSVGIAYGHEHGHYAHIDVIDERETSAGTIDHMVTSLEWSLRIGARF